MSRKILIAEKCHSVLVEQLATAGYECDYQPSMTNEEVQNIIQEYVGLIVRSRIKIDKDLIDKAVSLEFLGRVGSGMELINVEYAQQKDILCFNSPEGNRESVAEHVVGNIISLLKNIHISDRELRQNKWLRKDRRGKELGNQIVGIIGFGNTGSALAQKLSGFGCKILAYDKYKSEFGNKLVVESVLEDLYQKADIVSIHLPLTEETHFMVDEAFFNQFQKSIYFVNTSRGPIVKTEDLMKTMKKGKILGAAIDVFEKEPLEDLNEEEQRWWTAMKQSESLILTPHTAGLTEDSYFKLANILAKKIINHPKLSEQSHNKSGLL